VKFEGLWIEIVMEIRGGRIGYGACIQAMRVGKYLASELMWKGLCLIGVYTKMWVDGT
jgi:hypothetical protein